MKVAFSTLGCRVNQYESEAMTEKFIKEGYEVVSYDTFSDVYVINTCTVTNMGDKKSRQMVGRARRQNKDAIIAVVGCYSQIKPEEVSQIEGVDIVLGTRNKGEIVYWVNRTREDRKKVVAVESVLKNNVFEDLKIEEYQDRTRAFLKIQDGCNRFCSYCLIPYARGAVCSKKPETVMEEIQKLAENGFKEIILSGIHIASYGLDLTEKISLLDILEKMDAIDGIERIRIGSIDPSFFTEGTIEKICSIKKLAPHFHLSLQSGCDETLKRMNRPYTSGQYKNIVHDLRNKIKDVSITTDVIVGFPGESEEEFEKTYKFLQEIKLCKMHIFKYSPREGTKASTMVDQVPNDIKDLRSNKLIQLNLGLENAFNGNFINRTLPVLYEQRVSGADNLYEGYTANYIRVVSKCEKAIEGQILDTKLTAVEEDHLIGML